MNERGACRTSADLDRKAFVFVKARRGLGNGRHAECSLLAEHPTRYRLEANQT